MMAGWQPIETAPKDGTSIIVWDRGWVNLLTREVLHEPYMLIVRWATMKGRPGYWALIQSGDYAENDEAYVADDAYWMPRPAPPDVAPRETDPPYCEVVAPTEGKWVAISKEDYIREFGEEPDA